MSLGIPAITVSGGGRSENAHSLNEWFEPAEAWLGPQAVLLTILNYDGRPDLVLPVRRWAARNTAERYSCR